MALVTMFIEFNSQTCFNKYPMCLCEIAMFLPWWNTHSLVCPGQGSPSHSHHTQTESVCSWSGGVVLSGIWAKLSIVYRHVNWSQNIKLVNHRSFHHKVHLNFKKRSCQQGTGITVDLFMSLWSFQQGIDLSLSKDQRSLARKSSSSFIEDWRV